MNGHLTEDELDALLCGDDLAGERADHLQECLVCRRRRDALLAAFEGAAGDDPELPTRDRVRAAALTEWSGRSTAARRWWLAAAAAVLLAVVLPFAIQRAPSPAGVDADAVLRQVDEVLARDPLAVMASEDVLETVVPAQAATTPGGSAS
jgi:hypothetical protein